MSSLVTASERSVIGKITRSGLDTRRSRPPASTIVTSGRAMPGSSMQRSPRTPPPPHGGVWSSNARAMIGSALPHRSTGAERIVEALDQLGVRVAFGLPGVHDVDPMRPRPFDLEGRHALVT